jgi:hypothetical protein
MGSIASGTMTTKTRSTARKVSLDGTRALERKEDKEMGPLLKCRLEVQDQQGNRAKLPSHNLLMGGLSISFFLYDDSGLPMRFSLILSNLALARRCCGVWA